VLPEVIRVIIELDAEVAFHEERLEGPPRVFVDLSATQAVPALRDQTLRFDDDTLVHQIRLGRHPNNTTRVVLDADGISSFSVYPLYSPYRLVIDCVRPQRPAIAAVPPDTESSVSSRSAAAAVVTPRPGGPSVLSDVPALARSTAEPAGRPLATKPLTAPMLAAPSTPGMVGSDLLDAARRADAVDEPPVVAAAIVPPLATAPLPAPPEKNVAGGFSIARQLGLHVSRIVIDPGHGGHDPGAKGNGLTEADLVLDIALRLEKALAQVPGVEVVLTRRTDEFVPLQERTAIANREGADLFLSIHANASTSRQARGVETYFLNFATNPSAEAIAARENAGSDQAMAALPKLLNTIALNNKLDESRDLATMVQRALMEKLRPADKNIRDLGVKQAPFVVLIGAAMPSVLAEVSFLTNAQDSRLLKNGNHRQRIADALFAAIRRYQTSLKSTVKVAARP
jgi:N-acetylmuramoyl-L-alanine amidase